MALFDFLGNVAGVVDDFHYSGEEQAADARAQKQLEIDEKRLTLDAQGLQIQGQTLAAQQDMTLYLVGGAVAVAAIIGVAMMSR